MAILWRFKRNIFFLIHVRYYEIGYIFLTFFGFSLLTFLSYSYIYISLSQLPPLYVNYDTFPILSPNQLYPSRPRPNVLLLALSILYISLFPFAITVSRRGLRQNVLSVSLSILYKKLSPYSKTVSSWGLRQNVLERLQPQPAHEASRAAHVVHVSCMWRGLSHAKETRFAHARTWRWVQNVQVSKII